MPNNVVKLPERAPVSSAARGASHVLGERTDDELMRLAVVGQEEAFEALVRRHAVRVIRISQRMIGTRGSADELAQEVWISVWKSRATYRADGTFGRWLVTLVLNRCRNAKRNALRKTLVERAPDDSGQIANVRDSSPDEIERLLRAEEALRMQRALDDLDENFREALTLRFTEELAYEEIAAILGTNESTARSRVFYGLKELRKRFSRSES